MKITIMTGARPNFIKVAPLIWAIENAQKNGREVSYDLVYSGSEQDETIESSLFEDLQIPRPNVYLGVDSHDTVEITSRVMSGMETYLAKAQSNVVIVVDDLASTMAAAIVAKKHALPLAHLAAGTRSFDINMPKEINRLVIDGLSDYLFIAGSSTGTTANQAKIYNVGNILMDTLRRDYPRFKRPECLSAPGMNDGSYIVLTINRRSLLSSADNLKTMLNAMAKEAAGYPIIAPLRQEARRVVEKLCVEGINIVEPMSYLEFGYLTAHAKLIITDSGNIAEEATFNGIPCITLNNYTEHIETVKLGTNTLVNEDPTLLSNAVASVMSGNTRAHSIPEHWDGRTAERILQILSGV